MADGGIKLSSPQEVMEQIRRIAALLALYEEDLAEDAQQYASLGPMLEEAQQTLKRQRTNLQTSLEQVRKQNGTSEAAQTTERSLTARLSSCEEKLRQAGQYVRDYEGIRQDINAALQKSRQFSDTGKTLSLKMRQLLAKIIELM